ncbi:MAG: hypothetical protein SF028_15070 [Candidatus Sumerlaeia bacterium]|nr:hypothetical protein [Candidatus Sumerlaeia bacterium]
MALYDEGHANLSDPERAGLASAVAAMPSPDAVQANLEAEAHFVDPPGAAAVHQRYEEFLRALSGAKSSADFLKVCRDFHLRGVRTSAAEGKVLVRYSTLNKNLMIWIGNAILFSEGRYDPGLPKEGIVRFKELNGRGGFPASELAAKAAAVWDRLPPELREVQLHERQLRTIFAAIGEPTTIPLDDPARLPNALATDRKDVWGDAAVIEYSLATGIEARVPTVADCDGDPRFLPVQAPAPVAAGDRVDYPGWTKPLDGEAPVPELVHPNGSVSLAGPIRVFDKVKSP